MTLVLTHEALALAEPQESLLEGAVREHSRLIYRIAYSVLRHPADAEDVVQEVFMRMLRHGKKTDVQDTKPWLARIAWRAAVERRKRVVKFEAGHEEAGADLPSHANAADASLLRQERHGFLLRSIAALPDELRNPLVLSTLEELSPREVGGMLGISEAAVRSRTFRARQILRERLATRMGERK